MTGMIPQDIPPDGRWSARPVAVGFAIGAGALFAATTALWLHYGTAVFYETIVAGLNACF